MGNNLNDQVMEPYLYSCDNIITAVNKEFIDFTGFTMNELLGKTLIEVGDMLKINSQVYFPSINSNNSVYIFTKFFEAREVNISFFEEKEANQKKYVFVEKLNSRLKDKLIFVEQIFIDNISDVAVYSIPGLILLKANQRYLDFLDSPFNKEENSIGKSIGEIVNGFVGSDSEASWNNVIETQKFSHIKELKIETVERGVTYWDSSKTPIFENEKMKYIFVTSIEVTERVLKNQIIEGQNKIIEQKKELEAIMEIIRSQYEFLNRMIDTFNLPVVRISCKDFKVVEINKKAVSIIKLLQPSIKSVKQIKNNTIESLFSAFKTSEYYQCINEVLIEKKVKHLNRKNILMNGNELYFNIIFEPIFQVDKEIQEILILLIDVTTEIKSNIDMEKALKVQEELFANISHELKTPLNVIFATVQLFDMYCKNGSLDEKKSSIVKYIESIKQNSYRLSKLINNIVDISKIQAGFFELNLSNNNIVEVVEETVMSVTTFTESKGLNIIFDTDIEERVIACDPEKIERLILNLISNAIKFSNKGDRIFVDINDKNKFIEISVKDNGIGIEAKDLEMIFDRFKQVDKSLSRNAEGTGIGLSLVKSISELHGGSVYVESEFGKGSKFTVSLPNQKVKQENILFGNNMRSKHESIKMEFSDVCS